MNSKEVLANAERYKRAAEVLKEIESLNRFLEKLDKIKHEGSLHWRVEVACSTAVEHPGDWPRATLFGDDAIAGCAGRPRIAQVRQCVQWWIEQKKAELESL